MLHSVGSHRVRHNLATEYQQPGSHWNFSAGWTSETGRQNLPEPVRLFCVLGPRSAGVRSVLSLVRPSPSVPAVLGPGSQHGRHRLSLKLSGSGVERSLVDHWRSCACWMSWVKGDAPSGRKPPAGHVLEVSSTRWLPPQGIRWRPPPAPAPAGHALEGLQHTPAGFTPSGRGSPTGFHGFLPVHSFCPSRPACTAGQRGAPPPCPLTPPWADPGTFSPRLPRSGRLSSVVPAV